MSKIVTIPVDYQDVPLEVEAEFYEGEPAIGGDTDWARPGLAPLAVACRVLCGGIDIMQLLSPDQLRDIENRVVDSCTQW